MSTLETGRDVRRRALGPWSLTSAGLNMVVGAGFFLVPSQLFGAAGAWSPWLLAAVGLGMIPVALSFAEVGSRFDAHGGPYLYVRSAFGPLAGFETGWILWLSRVISHASVLAGLLVLLELVAGGPLGGGQKAGVVVGLTAVIAAFSAVGGAANARLITAIALIKLVAVAVLIGAALPHAEWGRVAPQGAIPLAQLGPAMLLALFCVTGFEQLAIPAGEARNPQRDVPRALALALGVGLALLIATNLLAIAVLPNLADTKLALAETARVAMGQPGWLMIVAAAGLAAVGNNVVSLLACSRVLQGLVDQGDAPAILGAQSRRGYPVAAVTISAVAIVALTLSGTFTWLIGLAGGVRVLIYAVVAIAAARLRAPRFDGVVPAPRFRTPAPMVVLVLALGGSLAVLAAMTTAQMLAIVVGAAVGLALYALHRLSISSEPKARGSTGEAGEGAAR